MRSDVFINVSDFMGMLKQEGLLIVSAAEFEASNELKRKKLLKRNSVSIKEIVDNRLLPLQSKAGVEHWIASGKILSIEVYQESTGRKMISTDAIRRLGYGF